MKKIIIIVAFLLLPGCGLFRNAAPYSDLSSTERTIDETNEQQIISVRYPVFEKQPELNETIKTFIDGFIKYFKENATNLEGEEKNRLTITYTPLLINKKIVSINFNVSTYSSGAAHGNWGSTPFNYSLANRKIITLSDLFASADYLNVLSGYCRRILEQQLSTIDPEMLASGTEPKKENYSAFGFKTDRLVFYFAPYQVAPYSAGEQMVEVPYTTITTLLTTTPFFNDLDWR